jgi:hypothetical protein
MQVHAHKCAHSVYADVHRANSPLRTGSEPQSHGRLLSFTSPLQEACVKDAQK